MITIFILLGLGFLGGGAAAIVDGLPYLVLERGFTQVIIGTVVSVAGALMLALSWVLVELRRLKKTLSGAAMAMSVASMVGGPSAEHGLAAPRMTPAPDDAGAMPSPGLAAAGAGALLGAGAGIAATQALAARVPGEPESRLQGEAAEPDLFGTHRTKTAEPPADTAQEALAGTLEANLDLLLATDPFRPGEPQGEPEPAIDAAVQPGSEAELPPVAAPDAEAEPMADIFDGQDVVEARQVFQVQDAFQAQDVFQAQDDGEAQDVVPSHDVALTHEEPQAIASVDEGAASSAAEPALADQDEPPTPAMAPTSRETDEFGMLRESLAGLGLGSEPVGGRVEPSFSNVYRLDDVIAEPKSGRAADFDAAASWMEPASQRRAPWFGDARDVAEEPVVTSPAAAPESAPDIAWPLPDMAERDAPEWPPHAREPAPFEVELPPDETGWNESASRHAALDERLARAAESEAPGLGTPGLGTLGLGTRDLATRDLATPEPAAQEVAAAQDDAAPAASDEGIVGAYQVGEAHFTIYADGSIQARTPDGDYSFTSMDELKIYLASEKSRLGV